MIIGLTGKYCAGKNSIAVLLENRGFSVLDVDTLGHIAIENKKTAIISRFGNDIKNHDGSVNRRILGEKVFRKDCELAALQEIVHPEANRLTLEWMQEQKAKHCVINASLLHNSVVFDRMDCIILVDAPLITRLIRAKKRDKLPWMTIFKRFSSQKHFFSHYFNGNADIYKVENRGLGEPANLTRLESTINDILSRLDIKNHKNEGGF